MPHNRDLPLSTRVVEVVVLIFMFLLVMGCWSQQPAPAAPTYDQLHVQWIALNKAYWRAATMEEKSQIESQLVVLGSRLDDMARAELAANTVEFEAMIPKLALDTVVTQPAPAAISALQSDFNTLVEQMYAAGTLADRQRIHVQVLSVELKIMQATGIPAHPDFVGPPIAAVRTHGPAALNDLTVTPGAVGTTPQATLCSPAFHTGNVRNVPRSVKLRVCNRYGIARADCTGKKVEIDHLISLELGGTNDEANLWPQPYLPAPGAKEKDVVENWLHRQVCTNAIPLATAQQAIATDWYQVYLTVPKANGGGGQ